MAPPPRAAHGRKDGLGHHQGTGGIRAQDLVPGGHVGPERVDVPIRARPRRVVIEEVDPPEVGGRRIDHGGDAVGVRHVTSQADCISAFGTEGGRHFFGPLAVPVGHHHPGAAAGQVSDGGSPDAGRRPGDDGHPALQRAVLHLHGCPVAAVLQSGWRPRSSASFCPRTV